MRRSHLVGVVALCALTLAGCAAPASSDPPRSGEHSSDAPLWDELPERIQQSGVITVATLDDLPPWIFLDEAGEFTGVDVGLTDRMSQLLGVEFEYTAYEFSSMIPGLQARRFDMIINEIGDTVEREEAVSFVDYTQYYTAIVVAAGNPQGIDGLDALCGLTVAAVQGSLDLTMAEDQSAACVTAGDPAITIVEVNATTDAYLAVSSGRADALTNSAANASYAISQGGAAEGLELAPGAPISPGLNGLAFNKDDQQLGTAIQAALQTMMDDGSYQEILDEWDVGVTAIPEAWINYAEEFAEMNAQ